MFALVDAVKRPLGRILRLILDSRSEGRDRGQTRRGTLAKDDDPHTRALALEGTGWDGKVDAMRGDR